MREKETFTTTIVENNRERERARERERERERERDRENACHSCIGTGIPKQSANIRFD